MDVLVCATQVPFMRGGLELHVENLVAALVAAGHRSEAVLVPAAWDRERLLDAALAWRLVPLDADVVIPLNFPSYFARHPRKVLWLAHQHRAAYDGLGQSWSDFGLDDESIEIHRQLVDWDTRVIRESERRYATSAVVAARLRRFNGLDAVPLHHPPPLADRLRPRPGGGPGKHVLCTTRLEGNKRPEMFINAMAASRSGVPGILTGRGTLAGEVNDWVAAAGIGDRIDVAGFVDDATLIDLMADAVAVVYSPLDEDYGYVTVQAFLAGVPVITAADSGGVLEWVTDGVTGFVTDGSPDAMGAAIDALVADPDLARRMGAAGRARVAGLSWEHVVETLVPRVMVPVMPPLIRARWRERLGLPAALVVTIGPDVDPAGEDVRMLSYAAAAVVTGPMLETALSLGTPLVTTAAETDRLGLHAGQDVEVADTDSAHGATRSPRRSPWTMNGRPGSRSKRGNSPSARLGSVGSDAATRDPLVRLDQRLDELVTPPDASIRVRAAAAAAAPFGPADARQPPRRNTSRFPLRIASSTGMGARTGPPARSRSGVDIRRRRRGWLRCSPPWRHSRGGARSTRNRFDRPLAGGGPRRSRRR